MCCAYVILTTPHLSYAQPEMRPEKSAAFRAGLVVDKVGDRLRRLNPRKARVEGLGWGVVVFKKSWTSRVRLYS